MANEIQVPYGVSGATLYAVVSNSVGQIWRTTTSTFVAFNGAEWADYDIALTEQGTSGVYVGNFPAAVNGVYGVQARVRAGGSPAQSDLIASAGTVPWSGTAVVYAPANFSLLGIDALGSINYITAVGNVLEDVQGNLWGKVLGDGGGVIVGTGCDAYVTAIANGVVSSAAAPNLDAAVSSRATPADVNAQVLDVLTIDTFAEPTGVPGATAALSEKIGRVYQALRNQLTVTATAKTFYSDGAAALWKKVLSDDGTTYQEAEAAAP